MFGGFGLVCGFVFVFLVFLHGWSLVSMQKKKKNHLQASMAKDRPLFPFNLILGYVSVV